jgi:hypothetical protein
MLLIDIDDFEEDDGASAYGMKISSRFDDPEINEHFR